MGREMVTGARNMAGNLSRKRLALQSSEAYSLEAADKHYH